MDMTTLLSPHLWAQQTFGEVQVRDPRRTRRAVSMATQSAGKASASLPTQKHAVKDLKATYRFLHEEEVTYEALITPHWQQTRIEASKSPLALLIQDTTELDSTHHPKTTGLGPIGDSRGRGLLLQSVQRCCRSHERRRAMPIKNPLCANPLPKARVPPSAADVNGDRRCGSSHTRPHNTPPCGGRVPRGHAAGCSTGSPGANSLDNWGILARNGPAWRLHGPSWRWPAWVENPLARLTPSSVVVRWRSACYSISLVKMWVKVKSKDRRYMARSDKIVKVVNFMSG